MKKTIFYALFICLMLFSGCGKEKEYISCESIVNSGIEKCGDFPEYIKKDCNDSDWEQHFEILYKEYADNVKDFCFVHSSEESRDDEIVAIRFDTPENAEKILKAMEERRKIRIEDLKSYASDNTVQIWENAVMGCDDVYAFYIACNNSQEVYEHCISMTEGGQ